MKCVFQVLHRHKIFYIFHVTVRALQITPIFKLISEWNTAFQRKNQGTLSKTPIVLFLKNI